MTPSGRANLANGVQVMPDGKQVGTNGWNTAVWWLATDKDRAAHQLQETRKALERRIFAIQRVLQKLSAESCERLIAAIEAEMGGGAS